MSQEIGDCAQEASTGSTIRDPMICCERERQDRPDDELAILDPRLIADCPGAHDGDLRRIDDRIEDIHPVGPKARDGDRGRHELSGTQMPGAHARDERTEVLHQRRQVLSVCVHQCRGDQSAAAHSDRGARMHGGRELEASIRK